MDETFAGVVAVCIFATNFSPSRWGYDEVGLHGVVSEVRVAVRAMAWFNFVRAAEAFQRRLRDVHSSGNYT